MKNNFYIPLFISLMLAACALPTEFPYPDIDKTYEDGVIKDVFVDDVDQEAQSTSSQAEPSQQSKSSDITLPPSLDVSAGGQQAEQNPDETVSFRRWREEQKKDNTEAQ